MPENDVVTNPQQGQEPPGQQDSPQPPPPAPPILGVDPPDESGAEPEPEEGQEPEPQESSVHNLDDETYSELQSKAAAWDVIERDPQLSQLLSDHFKARGTQTPEPTQQQNQQVNQDEDDPIANHPVVKNLTEQLQQTQLSNRKLSALVQLEMFRRNHPDLDQHESQMVDLLNRYPNMTIDEAYQFSKAKVQGNDKPSGSVSARSGPTAEGRGTGRVEEPSGDDILEEARARIMDPNAKERNIGPSFDTALAAAAKKHGINLDRGNW